MNDADARKEVPREEEGRQEVDHVVMFSGGLGSWAAAKRVAAAHGTERLTLLFTDTLIEDSDLYRFLYEAAENVGGTLEHLVEGRTIWEVFRDKAFLGNARIDPCSLILKRQTADRWMAENRDPEKTVVYVGIDWSEEHRFTRLRDRKAPWVYKAPMCDPPYLTKNQVIEQLAAEGIAIPRLYTLGFAHNNCGGGCVKAGIGHFAHLYAMLPDVYAMLPDVYAMWEAEDAKMRVQLGDVAILRDRTGGKSRPLPLSELRQRLEAKCVIDKYEIGGCGCFSDVDEREVEP